MSAVTHEMNPPTVTIRLVSDDYAFFFFKRSLILLELFKCFGFDEVALVPFSEI